MREQILGSYTLAQPLDPDKPLQQMNVEDIGALAATAFENPDEWVGREVDLTGDELTMPEVAEAMSQVTGQEISYYQVRWDQFREQMGEEVAVIGSPSGMQNYWKAGFVEELPDEAIDAFISHAQRATSPLTQVHLLPMGGALSRVADGETPLALRDSTFNFHAIGMWADPAEQAEHVGWVRELESVMRPWMSGRIYLNFIGDEGEERVRSAFYSETYRRLVALKDKYDPTNMFCLNQNIKPSQRQSQHVS